jgi:hypothetical protein
MCPGSEHSLEPAPLGLTDHRRVSRPRAAVSLVPAGYCSAPRPPLATQLPAMTQPAAGGAHVCACRSRVHTWRCWGTVGVTGKRRCSCSSVAAPDAIAGHRLVALPSNTSALPAHGAGVHLTVQELTVAAEWLTYPPHSNSLRAVSWGSHHLAREVLVRIRHYQRRHRSRKWSNQRTATWAKPRSAPNSHPVPASSGAVVSSRHPMIPKLGRGCVRPFLWTFQGRLWRLCGSPSLIRNSRPLVRRLGSRLPVSERGNSLWSALAGERQATADRGVRLENDRPCASLKPPSDARALRTSPDGTLCDQACPARHAAHSPSLRSYWRRQAPVCPPGTTP